MAIRSHGTNRIFAIIVWRHEAAFPVLIEALAYNYLRYTTYFHGNGGAAIRVMQLAIGLRQALDGGLLVQL